MLISISASKKANVPAAFEKFFATALKVLSEEGLKPTKAKKPYLFTYQHTESKAFRAELQFKSDNLKFFMSMTCSERNPDKVTVNLGPEMWTKAKTRDAALVSKVDSLKEKAFIKTGEPGISTRLVKHVNAFVEAYSAVYDVDSARQGRSDNTVALSKLVKGSRIQRFGMGGMGMAVVFDTPSGKTFSIFDAGGKYSAREAVEGNAEHLKSKVYTADSVSELIAKISSL